MTAAPRVVIISPDLEPLPWPDFRELGGDAAPTAAHLRWRVQIVPY